MCVFGGFISFLSDFNRIMFMKSYGFETNFLSYLYNHKKAFLIFKMSKIIYLTLLFLGLLSSCSSNKNIQTLQSYKAESGFKLDTLKLFDKSRNRVIPIAIYSPKYKENKHVVIVSHGYGRNRGGDYLAYSYLTENLVIKGYFIVSIQHELPTDSLIPMSGIPQIVRRPFWDRGADNILFVIQSLKQTNPELDFKHITLIGHSNGGDMTALFPQKYPNIVSKIITLDNRRMALPRTNNNPKVYSLRSSDQPADKDVLPTDEEQKKFNIKIVKLPNTIHNNMDDNANDAQGKEINDYVISFLKE
jgi:predicted esterase